jgi:demethylmenaquinone methyltransferase / 2-methoxy-6-polyprenyl-1,4-benzoquinol methylase
MSRKRRPWDLLLKEWPSDVKDRQAYVDPVFATIAPRYDLMSSVLSFGQEQRWKKKAVALIPRNRRLASVLDLACGTGEFPIHLRSTGIHAQIIGLDRSSTMMGLAIEKFAADPRTRFVHGDLMQIPFKDGAFEVITMGYGLRYVADIRQTLREVYRLLAKDGKFICLEFGLPRNKLYRKVCFGYLLVFGTVLGLLLHGKGDTYWHIVESLKAYPGQQAITEWLKEVGFADIELHEQLGGIMTILAGTRP